MTKKFAVVIEMHAGFQSSSSLNLHTGVYFGQQWYRWKLGQTVDLSVRDVSQSQ